MADAIAGCRPAGAQKKRTPPGPTSGPNGDRIPAPDYAIGAASSVIADDAASAGNGAAAGGSALLALWLLAGGWQPSLAALSVERLRRRARYAGLTMTAAGRPIRLARRAELLQALEQQGGR